MAPLFAETSGAPAAAPQNARVESSPPLISRSKRHRFYGALPRGKRSRGDLDAVSVWGALCQMEPQVSKTLGMCQKGHYARVMP